MIIVFRVCWHFKEEFCFLTESQHGLDPAISAIHFMCESLVGKVRTQWSVCLSCLVMREYSRTFGEWQLDPLVRSTHSLGGYGPIFNFTGHCMKWSTSNLVFLISGSNWRHYYISGYAHWVPNTTEKGTAIKKIGKINTRSLEFLCQAKGTEYNTTFDSNEGPMPGE